MADPCTRIAVMGATGTGKSTFVKLLTDDDKIRIGHSPESETFEIQTSNYIDKTTGSSVMLIDTPGFDDSREGIADTEILEKIAQFLESGSGGRQKLNGIIYMHRISDPRVGGVSRKNLRMFHSLCGDENLKNVRIVTTNWSRVSEQEGNHRENDLTQDAFKALLQAGARMRRHTNTLESACRIMSELIPLQAVTTHVQKELRDGKKLADTAAGRVVAAEVEIQRKHEKEMADLREKTELEAKMNEAVLRAMAEEERWVLEDTRARRMEADRAELQRTFEEQLWAQEAKMEEERANARQRTEQLLAQQYREEQAQIDRANEMQRKLGEDAWRAELELQCQITELNRRIAEAQNSDSGGGCVIA